MAKDDKFRDRAGVVLPCFLAKDTPVRKSPFLLTAAPARVVSREMRWRKAQGLAAEFDLRRFGRR